MSNESTTTIAPDQSVAQLASTQAGASRVFHRHGIDFCCEGHVPLQEACEAASLDLAAVITELEAERAETPEFERYDEFAVPQLIDHILTTYHEPHRLEVPRLIEMAEKVERVHGDKATCPTGLTQHLRYMASELEEHMQKEECVLFPMLKSGQNQMAGTPIAVMEQEHRDHAKNLERLRELTSNFTPPPEACGTWQALFLGLAQLQQDLMDHIHLENHVLFPKALQR